MTTKRSKRRTPNNSEPTERRNKPKAPGRRRPRSREALGRYLHRSLHIRVPGKPVCDGHDAPLDYLAHALLARGGSTLVWACRGGSKTMLGAALTVLESWFHPGLETCILGGSLAQSRYMYEYVKRFLHGAHFEDETEKITASRATLINGSRITILPASERTVRGVHVPRLRLDEVEEFRDDVFEAAKLIPQSADGVPARLDVISTLHRPYGIMSDLVGDPADKGLRLFKWCLWEVIEPCGDDRSCSRCVLSDDCQEKAKRADGYYTIDDAIAKKRLVSDEAWQSEMLCRRPSREGLFYKQYDEDMHVASEPIPLDPMKELYRTFDWGVNGPTVCLWVQLDGDGRVWVIDELYQSGIAVSDMAGGVLKYEAMRGYRNVIRSYCDPTGASYMLEFQKAGIVCQGRREDGGRANVRFEGFETVRRFLKPDEHGRPRLVVSPRCVNTRREFRTYHYPTTRYGQNPSEEPAKVDDHGMDALRYFFASRFPQVEWKIV
ncbi:MAG TPA: hypothetical protein VMY39_02010 [Planctomycetota bacterium]|nr:hypothetical protein [Planctomycetota bacterium]